MLPVINRNTEMFKRKFSKCTIKSKQPYFINPLLLLNFVDITWASCVFESNVWPELNAFGFPVLSLCNFQLSYVWIEQVFSCLTQEARGTQRSTPQCQRHVACIISFLFAYTACFLLSRALWLWVPYSVIVCGTTVFFKMAGSSWLADFCLFIFSPHYRQK